MIHKSQRSRVAIINTEDREMVFVKNWLGSGKYQLPGGGIKSSENVKIAARREVNEELGLELNIDDFKLFGKVVGNSYTKVFVVVNVVLPSFTEKTLRIAHHEITEVVTVKLKDIDKIAENIDIDTYNFLKSIDYSF